MRIGIDATLVRPDRLTGIERYALSLTTALARKAPGEIVLFIRPDAPAALTALPVEQHASPFRQRVPTEQAWLPLAAARAGVELLHTLAFPTPLLWRGPALLTVHDATPWLHPGTVSVGMRYYYGPLFRQALRRAAGLLTVSEAARDDLVATLGVARERVHVIHNGVDARFFEATATRGRARRTCSRSARSSRARTSRSSSMRCGCSGPKGATSSSSSSVAKAGPTRCRCASWEPTSA